MTIMMLKTLLMVRHEEYRDIELEEVMFLAKRSYVHFDANGKLQVTKLDEKFIKIMENHLPGIMELCK